MEIVNTIITGQELVGNARPMSKQKWPKPKLKMRRKKTRGIKKIQNIPARNVEGGNKEIVEERKNNEEEKEKRIFRKKSDYKEKRRKRKKQFV